MPITENPMLIQWATEMVKDHIRMMGFSRDVGLVRMVYKYRFDKDMEDFLKSLSLRIVELTGMPTETAAITVWAADPNMLFAAADRHVLVGGEYLYYAPAKAYAEEEAAFAAAKNLDKIRCRFCWKDIQVCNCYDSQFEEMKYDR
jgi:hypothetical protein